jgi:exopolysaccharide biosynthesis polyprenyl glycosylphosphotransferase
MSLTKSQQIFQQIVETLKKRLRAVFHPKSCKQALVDFQEKHIVSIRTEIENMPLVAVSRKIKAANSTVPRNVQWVLYIVSLIISDAVLTFLAFWLAYYFRFDLFVQYFDPNAFISYEQYRFLIYLVPFVWLVIFALNGLYAKDNLLGGTREYSKVFRSVSEGFLLIVIAGFLDPSLMIARGWLVMTWASSFLFVAIVRLLLRRIIYALRKQGFFLTPAVIVGANEEGRLLAEQLLQWETSGFYLVGFLDKKVPVTFPLVHNLVSLGSVEKLGEIIDRYNIGEVILASSAFSTRDYLLDIFRKFGVTNKVNIRMSSGLYEILTTSLTVNEYAYVPLVHVNKVRLTGIDNVMKFILDYVITIVGLIILCPFLVIIACCVKRSSPGPVFHRRLVMGLNGKQFYALKFRTMEVNGDEILENYPELKEELNKNHKLKNDPRITRIGAFLRKYSIDELPQLINVLKRDMSLVGPRMISPEEVSMYKQFDMNLLTVLPGITGLWQVNGRSDISYDDRVRLDMYYVRNWSIWLDLQLLFQTLPAVLKGRGAY